MIFRNNVNNNQQSDTQSDTQFTIETYITEKVLKYCEEARTAKEIRDYFKISSKRYAAYNIIKPLINMEKLEYTNKNSINAKNQKYKTKR